MNHIEEMMKTARVTLIENKCQDCPYNMEECSAYYCADFKYPDFTAEKQLEVIKLIATIREIQVYTIPYENEGNKYFVSVTDGNTHFTCVNRDFTQALAQLTTELMNAGELDKQKVKEILE